MILMDILLPDTNGVNLCQRLRSWHHCPIIFTSCLDDTETIVRALELGGDDFVSKPYDNKILLARIMANIRRVQMDAAEPSANGYHCAAFSLDANSHSSKKGAASIHLADMEYRIARSVCPASQYFFYRKSAVCQEMAQGQSGGCAHGAGPYPQSPGQDRAEPRKAGLPEKCLGKRLYLYPGRPMK